MQQFFIQEKLQIGETINLPEETAQQLLRVLRVREGDRVRLIDEGTIPFLAELKPGKKTVSAHILDQLEEKREHPTRIHLLLAKIKKDKWEWALQKATELGVYSITPVISQYTNVKDSRNEEKLESRYRKIMVEAAEQAERHRVPLLQFEVRLEDLVQRDGALSVVCAERTEGVTPNLLSFVQEKGTAQDVQILIGPEGGFAQEELVLLENKGFQPVSLGPRILRAETAAILAVGLVAQALPEEA